MSRDITKTTKMAEYKDELGHWQHCRAILLTLDSLPPNCPLCEIIMSLLFKTLWLTILLLMQVGQVSKGGQLELLASLGDEGHTNLTKLNWRV